MKCYEKLNIYVYGQRDEFLTVTNLILSIVHFVPPACNLLYHKYIGASIVIYPITHKTS